MWVTFPIIGPMILFYLAKPCFSVRGCTVILRNQKSYLKKAVCNMPDVLLKFIPLDLPENLAELDISFQNLQIIRNKEFIHLSNLEFLSITSSGVKTIEEGAFIQLSKLKTLVLSNNSLMISTQTSMSLSKYIFLPLLDLRKLDLSHNHVGQIPDFFFNHVNQTLEFLQLSYSKTEIILSRNSLLYLGALRTLRLEYSHMTNLRNDFEDTLNFMINLKELFLVGNLWNCDCQLKWFLSWMLKTFYIRHGKKSKIGNFVCHNPPDLRNRNLLKVTEMQCIPEPVTLNSTVSTFVGQNISLSCIFKNVDVNQTIFWENQNVIFTNKFIYKRFIVVETKGKFRKSILTILNVSKFEEGVWKCMVNSHSKSYGVNFMVNVEMFDFSDNSISSANKSKSVSKNATMYALISVSLSVFFIILLIVGIYYFKYYKGTNFSIPTSSLNIFTNKQSKSHFYKIGNKNLTHKSMNPFTISKDSIKLEEKIYDNVPISSGFYINFTKKKNEQNFSTLNCMDCQNFAIVDENIKHNLNTSLSNKPKSPRFWYLDDSIDEIDYLPSSLAITKDINLSDISEGESAFITRIPSKTPCPIHASQMSLSNFKRSFSNLSQKKFDEIEDSDSCPVHGKKNLQNPCSVHFSIPDHHLSKSPINTDCTSISPKTTAFSFPKRNKKAKAHKYFPVYLSSLDVQLNDESQFRQYSCLTNSVV